jgi:hypothetical protein
MSDWTGSADQVPSADLSSEIAQIRDLIQDEDPSDYMLSDNSITAALTTYGDVTAAAAACARKIAAKFSRKVSKSIGGSSVSLSDLATHYWTLAKELDSQAKKTKFSGMTAPTISQVSDVATYPARFVHGEEQPPDWPVSE